MEKQSTRRDDGSSHEASSEEVRGVDFSKCKKEGGLIPRRRKLVKRMVVEKIAKAFANANTSSDDPHRR